MQSHNGLWSRDFTLLIFGHLVSNLGNSIFLIVMLLFVQQSTGSPLLVGVVQASVFIPVMLFATRGGLAADRIGKRKLLVLSDSLRGTVMLVLAAGIALFPSAGLVIAVIASLVIGIGNAFFTPAVQSLIPMLAARRHLNTANALRIGGLLAAAVAGNILGGTLYAVLGTSLVLVLNGISFLLSAFSESNISEPGVISRQRRSEDPVKTAVKPEERCYIVMYSLFSVTYPVIVTAMPFYVSRISAAPEIWLGILVAHGFIGSIAGFFILSLLSAITDGLKLRLGFLISAAVLTVLGVNPVGAGLPALTVTGISLFFLGLSGSIVFLTVTTGLQIHTEAKRQGSVFGKLEAHAAVAAPLGYAAGGAALQFGSIALTFLILAAMLAAASLPAGPWTKRVCSNR